MDLKPEDIVGAIESIEIIASGRGIRRIRGLNQSYGRGRWRKKKGIAHVRMRDGRIRRAEIHWYEAHGIGKKAIKIKRYLS